MKKLAILAAVGVALSTPTMAHDGDIVSLDNSLARYDTAMSNAVTFESRADSATAAAANNRRLANEALVRYNSTPSWMFWQRLRDVRNAGVWAATANVQEAHAETLINQAGQSRANARNLLKDTIDNGTGTRSTETSAAWNTQWYAVDNLYGDVSNADRNAIIGYARQARPQLNQGWTGQGVTVINSIDNTQTSHNIVKSIAPQVTYGYGVASGADITLTTTAGSRDDVNIVSVGATAHNALHVGSTGIHAGLSTDVYNKAAVAGGAALVMDKFEGTSGGVIVDILNNTRNSDNTMNLTRAMSPHGVLR